MSVVIQMHCSAFNTAPMSFGPVGKTTEVEGFFVFEGDPAVRVYCKLQTVMTLRRGESIVFDVGALTLLMDRDKNVLRGVVDESKIKIRRPKKARFSLCP